MGQVIAGRFELVEHIASGASGSTWRARDLRSGRDCAAKVLRQKDSGELLRFVREQSIRLDHPHLATPYGWAAEDDDVAIAMPLVRGGTLESALADHGALSPTLTAVLLLQLLDALRHMHAGGWMHRDVKPANILLEPTGTGRPHLKLADFGTAMHHDEPRLTALGFVQGTPGYLSPETLQGEAPSPTGDLFAAGVVALRMLHPGTRDRDELRALQQRLPAAAGDAALGAVLQGLLADDAAVRTRTSQEAASRLAHLSGAAAYLTATGEAFEVFDHFADAGPDVAPPPPAEAHTATRISPVTLPFPQEPTVPAVATPPEAPSTVRTRAPFVMIGAGLLLVVIAVVISL